MLFKKFTPFLSLIFIGAALACTLSGGAEPTADATATFAVVLTQAGGTAKAHLPTLSAPTAATTVVATSASTSAPTPAPTFTTAPTATQSAAGCIDDAKFIADLTIPDGMVFATPAAFTKTWRIQNTGTCPWNTTYTLKFVGGAQLNGPSAIALPSEVLAGATVDLSVGLTSPAVAGNYVGQWRLTNAAGNSFGINGSPLTVSIVVPSPTVPPTVAATVVPGVTPPVIIIPTLNVPPIILLGSRASHYAGKWFNDDPNTTGITGFQITATSANAISVQGWGSCTPFDCNWGLGSGTVSGVSITVNNFPSAPGTTVLSVPALGSLRAVRNGVTYNFHQGPTLNDWVGTWTNGGAVVNNITKVIVGTSGGQITLHPYGKCAPTDCDWGTKSFPYTSGVVSTGAAFSHKLLVQVLEPNLLKVEDLTVSKVELFGR